VHPQFSLRFKLKAIQMRRNGQRSNESKSVLRSELRTRRREIPETTRTRFDRAICQHLQQLIEARGARSIACYWPFNGEPDILPLCRQLMAAGHRLALPVIAHDTGNLMTFRSWHENATLVENRYGICEPVQSDIIPVTRFDLLMMPLVGYDRHGNRIGMGAGYYDRHLELLRDSATPLRVGIAYSLQEIDPIEKNKWDIPLHGVVNERGWFTFSG
jgi:5-formyltetrahydrofolate cyclo-ligase